MLKCTKLLGIALGTSLTCVLIQYPKKSLIIILHLFVFVIPLLLCL